MISLMYMTGTHFGGHFPSNSNSLANVGHQTGFTILQAKKAVIMCPSNTLLASLYHFISLDYHHGLEVQEGKLSEKFL